MWLMECKVANYCKPVRQLLEKAQWEKAQREAGTPLTRYYSQWVKLREKEIQLEISGKDRMEDLDLPDIKRKKLQERKAEDKRAFKDLFDSDDSDEDEEALKIKNKKRYGGDDDDDDDLDLSDMSDEGLDDDDSDGSGGEDEEDEEEAKPSKAPKQLSTSTLAELAGGAEDLVEDLELSGDEDD
ncbi:hypothetical protein CRUP_011121 [Coryphaenoides rupestris]|nr:hypothetical protein CRUP_011121 [Coryphaenoides rupestris]